MKTNELRIGNNTNKGIVYLIGECDFNVYDEKGNVFCSSLDVIEPIALTEEWLLKFGFEKTNHPFNRACYVKDDFDFDLTFQNPKLLVLSHYNDEGCTSCSYFAHDQLKYVHQLQNLYYALTGEDICIKTDKEE